MSDADPPEGFPGFGGMGFPFDLSAIFGQLQGGDGAWQAARQLAITMATGGESEPNVDPSERIELEQLTRVAELQITAITGLSTSSSGTGVQVIPVTRADWAHRSLQAYRSLFEKLSASLGQTPPMPGGDDGLGGNDPAAAFMGQLMGMIAPMMMSMTAGSMIGHMARHYLGQYDIPLPRPEGDEIIVVPANIAEFEEEWSLPAQDLRLWVLIHEIGHHAMFRVPHIRAALESLLDQYASAFEPNPNALEEQLGSLDISNPSALADLQNSFGDPEVLLGAIRSPRQDALVPRINALTSVLIGVIDHIMDEVGGKLISSYPQLTEALHRRRVEADPSDRFIEKLLGLELTQEQCDRGAAFVSGVIERAGSDGLARLWESEINLPTPNEVDAPGLWLARIDLPAELLDPEATTESADPTEAPESASPDQDPEAGASDGSEDPQP